MKNRYDTSGNIEAQFEPGSNQRVLVNKLGITDPSEMVFTSWDTDKDAYFYAIQAGLDNYEPMKQLVRQVLRESV